MERPAKTLFTWQVAQATLTCAPVSGNVVAVLWLKVAPDQSTVVWQREQSWGNPAATWLGLVVFWKSVRWQEMQAVERPAYTLFRWQCCRRHSRARR